MDLKLQDKVALVTGAGSPIGFGRAIALQLAEEGCDVICADINEVWAKETASLVEKLGRRALAVDPNSVASLLMWARPRSVGMMSPSSSSVSIIARAASTPSLAMRSRGVSSPISKVTDGTR